MNAMGSQMGQMNAMGNYTPMSNLPKMHMMEGNYPPPPMPVYYDPSQPYDFAPPQSNPPSEPYDNRYGNWRDPSESKAPLMMNPPIPPMHFDMRPPIHHDYPPQPPKNSLPPESFPQQQQPLPPQVNVVQRISGIVKSQLSYLQSIMLYADRKTQEERNKKERERDRSRSRSRDRAPRPPQRFHREWNCIKCAFLNFDFRDRCKRCNEAKPEGQQQPPRIDRPEGGRGYIPGPDDWRCNKCGNINYARRLECHRCRMPRNK